MMIRLQPDMELAGVASTAVEAIRLYVEQRPDVLVLDLDLQERGALEVSREIFAADAGACIIGLATHPADHRSAEAMLAGVREYAGKEALSDSLPHMIRSAIRL